MSAAGAEWYLLGIKFLFKVKDARGCTSFSSLLPSPVSSSNPDIFSPCSLVGHSHRPVERTPPLARQRRPHPTSLPPPTTRATTITSPSTTRTLSCSFRRRR